MARPVLADTLVFLVVNCTERELHKFLDWAEATNLLPKMMGRWDQNDILCQIGLLRQALESK